MGVGLYSSSSLLSPLRLFFAAVVSVGPVRGARRCATSMNFHRVRMTLPLARMSLCSFRTCVRRLPISSETISSGQSIKTAIRTPSETPQYHYVKADAAAAYR